MKKLIPLLLLIVVFTAGCLPGGPITVTTSGQPPVINSFDASPPSISAGGSSMLTWKVSGATTVSIDQGIGNVALTGSRAVMPSATTVYTLTATNAVGVSVTATAQVMVSGAPSLPAPGGLPVVDSFTANPPGITAGSSATLSWNVSNATSVTIDPGLGTFASSGTTIVLPAATTTYILTATNVAGSTTAMTQVTVSGAPSPPPGLPVVNYFTANPPSITAGGSATLSWNVSNATSVTIDPGVGSVGLVGTAPVSPVTSTNYTLTATNAAGLYYITIPVLVTGAPPPAGEPDLVITDIQRVETPSGYRINYTIKNQGTADAGASTTKLYANTVYKASDSVGSLAAGASEIKQFTGWVFNPTTPQIKVVADANGTVSEGNETNNEKQVNYAIQILYNFVDHAGDASVNWRTGPPGGDISFGGAINDANGFACYRTSIKMENGTTYTKVLETHPKWVNDGWIFGYYYILHEVKPGEHFFAKVGLIQGASAGNVYFDVIIRPEGGGWVMLESVTDAYDSSIKTLDITIPASYFGKKCDFGLRVKANGSSSQDWATWVEARLIR